MDEMERYREQIERRYSTRRTKNDRRRSPRRQPKLFEKELLWMLAAIGATVALMLGTK